MGIKEKLSIFFLLNPLFAFGADRIVVLDVGEGQSILLQNKEAGFMIDTGSVSQVSKTLKKIHKLGVKTLDRLILTHLHGDHASGYFRVIEKFPKMKVYDNCHDDILNKPTQIEPLIRWTLEEIKKNPSRTCLKKGDKIHWKGFHLSVIWPKNIVGNDLNLNSLVLLVRRGRKHALLMGDVPKKVEEAILKEKAAPPGVDLFVAGHHGAEDTGSKAFIDYLKPKVSVVSVNGNNVWGHPSMRVIQLLKTGSESLKLTHTHGSVQLVF